MKNIFLAKFISLIIDYAFLVVCAFIILFFVAVVLATYCGVMDGLDKQYDMLLLDKIEHRVALYIFILFCFTYYSHVLKKSGQTIGEKIMKIKIVPTNGDKISLVAGIVRTLFLAPLLAIIGLIPASRNPYKSLLD
jgi:uncharacterized RDD family membrane protein YckC